MGIASLLKAGYQYTKTGLKYASALPRYAMGEGGNVISAARKSVGGGYTIFQNPVAKTKAGYQAFKADLAATVAKPSLWSKAKAVYQSSVATASTGKTLNAFQKVAAGTKGIASAVTGSVKGAWKSGVLAQAKQVLRNGGKVTTATKLWGGTKGILKPLAKMPLLGTLIAVGFEMPDIVEAFSKGGFGEGLKQVGKSTVKVGVGMAGSVVGTIIGGPVGGALGYMAGDILAGQIFKSYSESHPAETKEGEDELKEAQNNGIMPEETDTQALRDQLRQETQEAEQADSAEDKENTDEATAQNQNENELPATLQASDTSAQPQLTATNINPYNSQYTPYSNPFGFDAGTNIFQRFPMGYKFQYQGNGFGMMV